MNAERIATRRTADGATVALWSDGALTWRLGQYIPGAAHPRTPEQRRAALDAGWLTFGEIELYDAAEVPALVAAARWTAARAGDPGMLRARLHSKPALRPIWTTIEADRDGRPLVQVWKLPRLAWPGLSVWRERGSYSVWTEVGRTGTYEPTGVRFSTLAALAGYLDSCRVDL